MCGLLFEYDVRLSVKLYFTKSYMNIRTKKKKTPMGVFFFLVPRGTQSLCKGLVCALMKRERKP